jgi:outer membrane lipoprotein-sorting protein
MRKSIVILVVLGMVAPLYSGDLTGEDIVTKVNEVLSPESSHGMSKMTIVTTSGDERTFVMESWSAHSGEKNLIRYREPRRVKDQAILMLNNADDIWMYFPRTQRVRKLATHAKKQKMQGSDFSYEDMGGGDAFVTDFTAKRLPDEPIEGHDCYRIELVKKKDSDMSYSRLILWVVKESYFPVVIDYYDEDDPGHRIKRLAASEIEVIDAIPTARRIVMTNMEDNTHTTMETIDVEYNVTLDDNLFSERGLKQ